LAVGFDTPPVASFRTKVEEGSIMLKLLYTTAEARLALGVGCTKFYQLLNEGLLEARRLGRKTYITAESLKAFVASLPPVVTPTMARAEHDRCRGGARLARNRRRMNQAW